MSRFLTPFLRTYTSDACQILCTIDLHLNVIGVAALWTLSVLLMRQFRPCVKKAGYPSVMRRRGGSGKIIVLLAVVRC